MKHSFRIIIGMLLLAIPLCLNAQVKPVKKDEPKAEKPKAEKPEIPEKPKGGIEMPKISGFVQGMFQANLTDEGKLMEGDKASTFRMRRVRLSVDGKLSKTVSYKIQGDFTRSPMLVDAFIKYKPCREFAIQLGQFKTPFTLESPINPVNLEIFDYGEAVQQLVGYKDVCGVGALGRDLGIMATGSLFHMEGEEGYKYSIVDYAVGVFNGNGANQLDNNNRKDIVGRLEVHPGLKNLTLSGSYYNGYYTNKTVEAEINDLIDGTLEFGEKPSLDRFGHGTRNRWSAGIHYNDGSLVIRGEFLNGITSLQNLTIDTLNVVTSTDAVINSRGYYAEAGYYFKFGKEGKEQKLMPVLRFENFSKDTSIAKGGTNWYTVGINYWPLKSVNFKLDYSLVQKEAGDNSHRVVGILSYKF